MLAKKKRDANHSNGITFFSQINKLFKNNILLNRSHTLNLHRSTGDGVITTLLNGVPTLFILFDSMECQISSSALFPCSPVASINKSLKTIHSMILISSEEEKNKWQVVTNA